jgi:hypothetical protein
VPFRSAEVTVTAAATTPSGVIGAARIFLGALPFAFAREIAFDALPAPDSGPMSRPVTAAAPAATVAAVGAAVGGARAAGRAADFVVAEVQAAAMVMPRTFFYFPRIDAAAAFNDAMAAFIADSAGRSEVPAAASQRRLRAWLVTAAVAAADVALLVSWQRSRAKRIARRAGAGRGGRAVGSQA